MKWLLGSLPAALVVCVVGCAQTDPASMCNHVADLQHGRESANAARVKEYKRLCLGPMTQAKLDRPEEYRCWSKCMLGINSWPETARCDSCVGSRTEFELFQVSKTRKKAEQERQKDTPSPAPSGSTPAEAGSCGDGAACGP